MTCCLSFALEACECLCVLGDVIRQELQSHKAVQPYILGFVHDSHPAPAQLLNDAVVGVEERLQLEETVAELEKELCQLQFSGTSKNSTNVPSASEAIVITAKSSDLQP